MSSTRFSIAVFHCSIFKVQTQIPRFATPLSRLCRVQPSSLAPLCPLILSYNRPPLPSSLGCPPAAFAALVGSMWTVHLSRRPLCTFHTELFLWHNPSIIPWWAQLSSLAPLSPLILSYNRPPLLSPLSCSPSRFRGFGGLNVDRPLEPPALVHFPHRTLSLA